MNDITIHHLGYLVKNIQKSKNVFIDMGFQLKKDIILDDVRDAYICFLGGGRQWCFNRAYTADNRISNICFVEEVSECAIPYMLQGRGYF